MTIRRPRTIGAALDPLPQGDLRMTEARGIYGEVGEAAIGSMVRANLARNKKIETILANFSF
jgi:hypothetical protein